MQLPNVCSGFLSAPPHGGRPRANSLRLRRDSSFYPRPRTGGDIFAWCRQRRPLGFYPRPRTGGDVPRQSHPRRSNRFLSAPPHGGRLRRVRQARPGEEVSIRAPARGATENAASIFFRDDSFYPRPRTGGDFEVTRSACDPPRFLSAPPHGGRHLRERSVRVEVVVSIRAPARGATPSGCST